MGISAPSILLYIFGLIYFYLIIAIITDDYESGRYITTILMLARARAAAISFRHYYASARICARRRRDMPAGTPRRPHFTASLRHGIYLPRLLLSFIHDGTRTENRFRL